MEKRCSYELLSAPAYLVEILELLPQGRDTVLTGVVKSTAPSPEILEEVTLKIENYFTNFGFIRKNNKPDSESTMRIFGEGVFAETLEIDCDSFTNPLHFKVAAAMVKLYLTKKYKAVLHFIFGFLDGEHFESIRRLDIYFGWDLDCPVKREVHLRFEERFENEFMPLVDKLKEIGVRVNSSPLGLNLWSALTKISVGRFFIFL